jgi:protein ImuA
MSAASQTTLHALRRAVADIATATAGEGCGAIGFGIAALDQVLAGGLARGALHEIGPAAARQGGAAAGFAIALTALALAERTLRGHGQALWILPDFAATETGAPYGQGLELMGLPMGRLVIVRVPRPRDALWAMEEALKCRAVAAVVAELASREADLTATRRLAIAAREGGGLGLILHPDGAPSGASGGTFLDRPPSTATTRWEVASARSEADRFGGLGPPTFVLSLVKNRRGRIGQWCLSWDHHACAFATPLSLAVAAAARDGSPRGELLRMQPLRWAG